MAFVDAGYDGTVDEVQFAKLLNRYSIVGPDDFKASNTTGDRMLSIANGTALGPGTLNVGTAFSPIQFDAVSTGTTRWDLVVLRRDWQPPGGATTIQIIKGGANPTLPARNQNPGVIDDQPLYLQQVNAGSTSLGTRLDLRVWQGPGGAEAGDKLALTYLAQPGAAVKIGGTTHHYELQGNGVWGWSEPFAEYAPLTIPSSAGYGTEGAIYAEKVGTRTRVTVNIRIYRASGTFAVKEEYTGFGAILPVAVRGTSPEQYLPVALSGGGGQNHLANIYINPSNGVIGFRGQTPFTWLQGARMSIVHTYYI